MRFLLLILIAAPCYAQVPPAPTPDRVETYNPSPPVYYQPAPVRVYQQPAANTCPQCGRVHSPQQRTTVGNNSSQRASDGYPIVYTAPGYESQYQQCVRDVQFYASGNPYPGRHRGHPFPVSMRAGTGYSHSPTRPNTCFYRSGRTLVARARMQGRNGRWYYSARYK